MEIEKIKKQIDFFKLILKSGLNSSYLKSKFGFSKKEIKEKISVLKFKLWSLENPESFNNHKKAIKDFLENTHIF